MRLFQGSRAVPDSTWPLTYITHTIVTNPPILNANTAVSGSLQSHAYGTALQDSILRSIRRAAFSERNKRVFEMKKKELTAKTAEILRERDARKTVPPARSKLYVRDEEGNQRTLSVVRKQKSIPLNEQDVSIVIDALIEAILDNIRNGGDLTLYGMGTLAPHYRAPRQVRNPRDNSLIEVPPHLTVKYTPGKYIKTAIRVFESTQTEEEMKMLSNKYSGTADEDEDGD